jgi:hypothetical protein
MARASVVFIIAIGLCTSCKPKPVHVNGDVFIATKGGQAFKLPLVNVHFVPAAVAATAFAEKRAEAERQILALKPKLQAALATVGAAKATEQQREEVRSRVRAVWMSRVLSGEAKRRFHAAERTHLEAKLERLKRERDALQIALEQMNYSTADFFLLAMPAPIAQGQTDADGRFSVEVLPGEYVVAAHAQRFVGAKNTEKYGWLFRVTIKPDGGNAVRLSNDNLFETECGTCLTADKLPLDDAKKAVASL